jgi:hypothetical protein
MGFVVEFVTATDQREVWSLFWGAGDLIASAVAAMGRLPNFLALFR